MRVVSSAVRKLAEPLTRSSQTRVDSDKARQWPLHAWVRAHRDIWQRFQELPVHPVLRSPLSPKVRQEATANSKSSDLCPPNTLHPLGPCASPNLRQIVITAPPGSPGSQRIFSPSRRPEALLLPT